MMKKLLRAVTPRFVLQWYHWLLAWFGALLYGFPSRKLLVIGVTGTTGKSTVVEMLAAIFMKAGEKVGSSSTIRFRIGNQIWMNNEKMTMLGRFGTQRLLRDMVREGCYVAIIETTSEGIAQSRHVGISYDAAVFTNLTPEHIESHGSFERYKASKEKLFSRLHRQYRKPAIPKIIVANDDDPHADDFLRFDSDAKIRVSIKNAHAHVDANGSRFTYADTAFTLPLPGDHNVSNALLAIVTATAYGVSTADAAKALATFSNIPGRFERIEAGQPFTVIVDYAHEPVGLKAVYRTARSMKPRRMIAVLGAAGGGRDKWKRSVLGKVAAKYATIVIITNEDPYDENPVSIMNDVAVGAREGGKKDGETLFLILDREGAIQKAIHMAKAGDIVMITGKGSEQSMVVRGRKKIPWSDAETVKKALVDNIGDNVGLDNS